MNNVFITKTKEWFQARPLFLLAIVFLAVWLLFALVWKLATRVPSGFAETARFEQPPALPAALPERRLIDGVMVSSSEEAMPALFAAMIDFNVQANPVSGVDLASLVYEVPVEGGITRLMAFFPLGARVPEVGPIRSARPYFIDLASEYDTPLYAHVGGSPDALERLKNTKLVLDINEFFAGNSFWRDKRRYAPHSTYTSSELLTAVATEKGFASSSAFGSWLFSDIASGSGVPAARVTVSLSRFGYGAVWVYNKDARGLGQGAYVRQYGSGPYRTRDRALVMADTLVVQETKTRVLDDKGRLEVITQGEGTAWFFRDGVTESGTWKYKESENRTRFYDAAGREMALKPGKIWVHVVPMGVAPVVRN